MSRVPASERKAAQDPAWTLRAALPRAINFRFLPPRAVGDPVWDEIAVELAAALAAHPTPLPPLDAERLAEASNEAFRQHGDWSHFETVAAIYNAAFPAATPSPDAVHFSLQDEIGRTITERTDR